MLIQKVFHVRQNLEKAQARFSNFPSFSDRFRNSGNLDGFAGFADGRVHWGTTSRIGFLAPFQIELLPTDDKRQVLFHSTGGEMELCGLMELLPVRDRLTEVQLTLEYEIQSPLRRLLDRLLGVMNRRVNRQILEFTRQMDDDGEPETPPRFVPWRFIPARPSSVAGEPHSAR
jgi:hypothetical protein